MEEYLLQNVQRYQLLVKRFVPPPAKRNAAPEPTASNLVVATRIRPILEDEISSGQVPAIFTRKNESGVVDLHELKRVVRGLPTLNSSVYQAGKVYGADSTTDTIYEDIVHPLLPWVWAGNVGTLFAYGQTGSGKTFSISRLERSVAGALFDGSLPGKRKIFVSIFELAGSSARDLLSSQLTGPAPFQLLEDSFGDIQLSGASEFEVGFTGEFLQLIEQATAYRKTASTEKNSGSSRSHAVCRLRIVNPDANVVDDGYLYLVDLAGSEAARDIFDHSADRMKETREINMSLSVLKDCIRSIAGVSTSNSKKSYVPFRQSTLTKTLKHVFDPSGARKCKTAVLACVNPSFLDTGATKNTLRYAEMLFATRTTHKQPGHNPNVPMTWSNKDVRHYIVTKSGNPSVAPFDLAPNETGAQLLRLPVEIFVERCMKTPGVTEDQARAFHLKLWSLHTDSQQKQSTKKAGQGSGTTDRQTLAMSNKSSRDLSETSPGPPFIERIRPGITISWNPPAHFPFHQKSQNLAVVLCPQDAAGEHAVDVRGNFVQRSQNGEKAFLCALVLSGETALSYEIHLWKQFVVPVQDMQAEVILEYDPATRYYHISV